MRTFLNRYFDIVTIVAAIVTMVLFFIAPKVESGIAVGLFGLFGVGYICYALHLWFRNRVMFDWYMINGHFLRKVVCVVVLLPFVVATILYLAQSCGCQPLKDGEIFDFGAPERSQSLLWGVYYHFIDPGNQHMASSAYGWVVALIAILGVFLLNGVLVSSIVGWIDRRREQWLTGELDYTSFLSRKLHSVVIGGCEVSVGLVRQIFDRKSEGVIPYVVVQTTGDVARVRRKLYSILSAEEQQHLIIRYGDRTSLQDLRSLAFEMVDEVYIIGEEARADDVESNHDSLNMECLEHIVAICNLDEFKRPTPLPAKLKCHVMFEYQTSYAALKVADVNKEKISFSPFNFYESWAQRLLIGNDESVQSGERAYRPLDGEGIKVEDDSFVHLIIVGMSRMGVALGIEAAHLAHYPNFVTKGIRTRITFIDTNAKQEMAFFQGRFKWLFELSRWRYAGGSDAERLYISSDDALWQKPDEAKYEHLGGDFLDVEWEFVEGSVESASVRQYLTDAVNNPNAKVSIAVCLPEPNKAVATALYLPAEVYDGALQVFVYQRDNSAMLASVSKNNPLYKHKLLPFGLATEAYDERMIALCDDIGSEVGKKYDECSASIKAKQREAGVEMPVEKSPVRSKTNAANLWSNRYSVYSMWAKFRGVGFNPDSASDFTPEQLALLCKVEHNRWNMEQLLLGFRPLTPAEQAECALPDSCAKDYYERRRVGKDAKKRDYMAHLDICANELLDGVDSGIAIFDEELTSVLPSAYRKYCGKDKK